MKNLPKVEDVMLVVGGTDDDFYGSIIKTSTIIMSDGTECKESNLVPDLPDEIHSFGLAVRKERWIYVCGGKRLVLSGSKTFYYILISNH